MRNRLKDGWKDDMDKPIPKPTQERDNPFGCGGSMDDLFPSVFTETIFEHIDKSHEDFSSVSTLLLTSLECSAIAVI